MPKPALYKPEYCDDVINYVGSGHSLEAWAGTIGVHRQTVYQWTWERPEFAEAVKIAKDRRTATIETMLEDIARTGKGNAAAAIFIAKNRAEMRDDYNFDHTSGGKEFQIGWLSPSEAKKVIEGEVINRNELPSGTEEPNL